MPKQTVISVDHVSKQFLLPHERSLTLKSTMLNILKGKVSRTVVAQQALSDISFEIKQGEFFGILGRNGSGKSTLLKILAGIYQPTAGKVDVKGRLVPFIELGVGFNPELTGRDNVYLNGALMGFDRAAIDKMYKNIVQFAELDEFMDQKLKNYSSGMQVRLAFSLATRAKADILLVDEVLAVGDQDFQRKCFDYFKSLKKRGTTVIFVSHDMSAVREYCDRAILIEDSCLVFEGKAENVAVEYSKLFNEDSPELIEEEETSKRWGNGDAEYESAAADVIGEEIIVRLKATAKRDIDQPVFGFSLRNATGLTLFGTNTKLEQLDTGLFKAGEKREIVWRIPNILNDGTYTIDPAIHLNDAITVCDWQEDAAAFKIKKEKRTPYITAPPVNVSVKRAK